MNHHRIKPVAPPTLIATLSMVIFFSLAGLIPAFAEMPAGCDQPLVPQKLDQTRPLNLGELKLQLRYYRCTRYDAEVAGVLRNARIWIEQVSRRVKKPAIVLDIDETSLSNWKEIYQNDYGYIPNGACDFSKGTACGEVAWEHAAKAAAIEPTLRLFNTAKAKNITVFFITGRYEGFEERAATEANRHNVGYDGWKQIYMRTETFDGPSVAPFKTAARRDIEQQGYTIIANVGDQQSDLQNGHALRRFKVPNPFYYIK